MATEEHLKLSEKIKAVHKSLREKTKKNGPNRAWIDHLKSKATLQTYADAMKELAINHWESNDLKAVNRNAQQRNRIIWSVDYCKNYFFKIELINALRNREFRILKELEIDTDGDIESCSTSIVKINDEKIKLLDVGSCYNPFSKFTDFDVVAIDIAPAVTDVIECDFLNVQINSKANTQHHDANSKKISEMFEETFDAVVFSLLLEYLPTSEQRICCCQKAYQLLKTEGLLIIITPDSKHVGANAKLMKTWRYALALMGFGRIKYEKLEHISCMAFRKCINAEVSKRWARIHKESYMDFKIEIPQDFNAMDA